MFVVDRLEGKLAILLVEGATVEVPGAALPDGTQEGAVLTFVQAATEEAERRAAAEARLQRLQARDTLPDEIDL